MGDVLQREGHTSHSSGRRLLARAEMSERAAVLPVPHALGPHGGSDLHLERPAHLLLPGHRQAAADQAEGEEQVEKQRRPGTSEDEQHLL